MQVSKPQKLKKINSRSCSTNCNQNYKIFNEVLHGDFWRSNFPGIWEEAIATARAADPNVELFVNDFQVISGDTSQIGMKIEKNSNILLLNSNLFYSHMWLNSNNRYIILVSSVLQISLKITTLMLWAWCEYLNVMLVLFSLIKIVRCHMRAGFDGQIVLERFDRLAKYNHRMWVSGECTYLLSLF